MFVLMMYGCIIVKINKLVIIGNGGFIYCSMKTPEIMV
ncbi:hypothetical protein DCCM_0714 [Desulfocucumis palustris]|uniref:Uncharacterized protein n=1 Tax=Desulfocucumis palustris TaxID=1898651 RepID=A0A2L2X8S7_9FIRM|nr:hypothetical protein DCCM_0714 [Desulfocucumis palustris]